jgi:hypothetical protein
MQVGDDFGEGLTTVGDLADHIMAAGPAPVA